MFLAYFHAPGKANNGPIMKMPLTHTKLFLLLVYILLPTLMHLFSRHDLELVPKIPMLQTLVTISSQSQQINISKRFNLLWKSVMQCTFLRCKSIPEKVSPSQIIHFRAN